MKTAREKIQEVAETLGWSVSGKDNDYSFETSSTAGQDLFVDVTAKTIQGVADALYNYYQDYDCSEEAALWLDSSGHGKNGAPYEMIDVYKDMQECEQKIKELSDAVEKLAQSEEDEE